MIYETSDDGDFHRIATVNSEDEIDEDTEFVPISKDLINDDDPEEVFVVFGEHSSNPIYQTTGLKAFTLYAIAEVS